MKLLVIGSGGFAQKHASLFSEIDDVTVCAFCSRTAAHAKAAAARLAATTGHEVASYTDLREALDRELPQAAVVVVTPYGHGEIERELISRRVPFLVEKPIGIDTETPAEIARLVEESGLVTSVGFHMRYLDIAETLRTMLTATSPVLANGYWMGTLPPPAWWRHRAESGGQFVEQTVHMIDLLRYLLGEVESVSAMTSQQVLHELHADADVPDAGAAVLRMESGMTATLINSCVGPQGLRVGLEIVTPPALFEFAPNRLTVRRGLESTETQPGVDPYRVQDTAFIEAIRTGDAGGIRSPYSDALRTHAVSMAIVESAERGGEVTRTRR